MMRLHPSYAPILLLSVLSACSDEPTNTDSLPAEIRLLTDPLPAGTSAWPLADSVVIEVLDSEGEPVSGAAVSWTVGDDAGQVVAAADTTNVAGRASADWTLGAVEGEQLLSVRVGDLDPVTVRATATVMHASSVTTGGAFACALTADGQALCWGSNFSGQLGVGTIGGQNPVPRPVQADLSFQSLSASSSHVCGLTADGTAYCWGSNNSGESGIGVSGSSVPVPTAVQTVQRFTDISAQGQGEYITSTCALSANGEAWCWGANLFGKLGDGSTENSAVPVRVQTEVPFARIETGFWNTCAMTVSGALYCWGEQADVGVFNARPPGIYPTPLPVSEGFAFEDVVLSSNSACGLTPEGRVLCWGQNWFGSLGGGGTVRETAVPLEVHGGLTFLSLSPAHTEEIHALSADGTVFRWGSLGNDQVQSTPVALSRSITFSSVDGGGWTFPDDVSLAGACGIVDGAVYCVRDDGLVRGVPQPGTTQ
jgi:alpha-tubulin suppressor-like RCC1 family protein